MTTEDVVAAARLRLLLDERLGRDTPVDVIRLAAVQSAPADRLTVVVDRAEFEESVRVAMRGHAERGLGSWMLRIGIGIGIDTIDTGEDAVREVGRLLLAECGPTDLLSRLGATEFAALVSGTHGPDDTGPDDTGAEVAERMRRVVAEHPWATPVRLTIDVADVTVAAPVQPVHAPVLPRQRRGWSIPSRRKRS